MNADHAEELTVGTIAAFLTDRIQLKEAILALGRYSEETAKLMAGGPLAARRLSLMARPQLRELLVALVSRADVNRSHPRLLICCYELSRYLSWDGNGLFKKATIRPKGSDRFRMVNAPANLICTRPEFTVPVHARFAQDAVPNGCLVSMLRPLNCTSLCFVIAIDPFLNSQEIKTWDQRASRGSFG